MPPDAMDASHTQIHVDHTPIGAQTGSDDNVNGGTEALDLLDNISTPPSSEDETTALPVAPSNVLKHLLKKK
jgi:hypothetical protein